MSDQDTHQEPSMEEILASIRRIISEDGAEKIAAAPRGPAVALPDAAERAKASGESGSVVPELEKTTDEDVLELTDEVQDDGTVVNFNTGEIVAEERTSGDFVETIGLDAEVALETIGTEEEPDKPIFESSTGPATQQKPKPVTADVLAAEAAEGLISGNSAMNSVASLSALAIAVDTHRRAGDPSIGPRTIEDLVKDVMRPMIREWLDQNLPTLVERMVGREIERLTREAEDISQR